MHGYLFQVEKVYLLRHQWMTEKQLKNQLSDLAKENHYWDYIDPVIQEPYQEEALSIIIRLLPSTHIQIENEGRTITFLTGFKEAYEAASVDEGESLADMMRDFLYIVDGTEEELSFHEWVYQLMETEVPYQIGSIFDFHY